MELNKTRIIHKEPLIVGLVILQYAKLTMLQLKYNFFSTFCNKNKYELIEMDNDSLYMALSEEKLDKIIQPEMQSFWYWMRQSDCSATSTRILTREPQACSKKNLDAQK